MSPSYPLLLTIYCLSVYSINTVPVLHCLHIQPQLSASAIGWVPSEEKVRLADKLVNAVQLKNISGREAGKECNLK